MSSLPIRIPELRLPLARQNMNQLEKHAEAVGEVKYDVGSGFHLLEDVETEYRDFFKPLDQCLPRSRKQILTERVLLLGANYLFDHGTFGSPYFHVDWQINSRRYDFYTDGDGEALFGIALFDAAPTFAARLGVVLGALNALAGADIKLGLANLDTIGAGARIELHAAGFVPVGAAEALPLQARQYVLFVNVHTNECGLFAR